MKKLILLGVLITSMFVKAQTAIDLSGMTGNTTLGQNCSSSQEPQSFVTSGDLNLNGFKLRLKNATLIVNGNLNGSGEIDVCGQSTFCVNGVIQNNPVYDPEALCNTLSSNEYELDISNIPINIRYRVYDISGKLLDEGFTDDDFYNSLPKQKMMIVLIKGYKHKKIYKK